MITDIEEELKILENSVRDILNLVLFNKHGTNWEDFLKISPDRVENWKKRKDVEIARFKGVALETRLLYYSDFYDLKNIIDKHWDDGLVNVFQEKKSTLLFLEEAEKFRDPNAHRRELFEYQKHLIKGISGELRIRIMKFRGKRQNPDGFFPVIEAVKDSLGNGASNTVYAQQIITNQIIKVGDSIEIIGYSSDPLGGDIEYSIERIGKKNWSLENKKVINFTVSDIGKACDIQVMVRSKRDYHAYSSFDDYVDFRYLVIP
ncbi:hypothetical protein [Mucilaginibacter polytrichastri]|uniref:Swt1-like HEPN domain-containing protein n=1 Tax=Mucilaginibacter polytrichastri TaxID=1302689 RepID=A0A1Q5ZW86_9SPHI|nr:hypothetical protein [Mucilaginibacter polytrichastri]OKS86003.1 hypothetical protein RG47T_1450 [Mucilaginibacter polytrichastri]SFS59800.1 hypothetical protein SAMN04487890_102134 [Mucilaginibacter polytrichastri]